jgi:hypothetical protein
MLQTETTKKNKGILERLPKLGRLSQLVLLIGVFLVIFVGLLMLNNQLSAKQTTLNSTLTNLQKILTGAQQTPQSKYEGDLAQATAQSQAAKASYPTPNQAPEILDSLLALAASNDVYVTGTAITSDTTAGAIGPTLTFDLGLKGQIPKFENFLLALDKKLPTSRINTLTFVAAGVGQEYDTATIKIDVLSYAGD